MHFGFMNVILLYSDRRHVSATHVAVFRVASARIHSIVQLYGFNHWRDPTR